MSSRKGKMTGDRMNEHDFDFRTVILLYRFRKILLYLCRVVTVGKKLLFLFYTQIFCRT